MPVFRSVVLGALLLGNSAFAALPATLYKSPSCGCCEAYVSYLGQNGFAVSAVNRDDMPRIKQQLGVSPGMGSCHTVKIGAYVIEGHVPVAAIRQLLARKPALVGIAVPGMPAASPGMGVERPGTLAVYQMTADQRTGVLFGRF